MRIHRVRIHRHTTTVRGRHQQQVGLHLVLAIEVYVIVIIHFERSIGDNRLLRIERQVKQTVGRNHPSYTKVYTFLLLCVIVSQTTIHILWRDITVEVSGESRTYLLVGTRHSYVITDLRRILIQVKLHRIYPHRVFCDEVIHMSISLQPILLRGTQVSSHLFIPEPLHEEKLTDRVPTTDIRPQCRLRHHLLQQVDIQVMILHLLLYRLSHLPEVINHSKQILRTAEVEVHITRRQLNGGGVTSRLCMQVKLLRHQTVTLQHHFYTCYRCIS